MEKVDNKQMNDPRPSFEVFRDANTVRYYIGVPNADQLRKAEWHYAKIYNKALVEGLTTQSEMLDILRQRGLYGDDYESHLESLRKKITDTLDQMATTDNQVERYNLAREAENLRSEFYRWNARLTGPMRNTCEQIADDAKVEFLTSQMIQHQDGKPVWKTFEDFLNDPDQTFAMQSRMEVYLALQGIDKEFLSRTPERVVIESYEKGPVEVKELTSAVEQAVDAAVPEAVEPKPRTRARKKSV
jgi:hypothetical protein